MTGKLFAKATMVLEDMHGVAVEGQRRDVPVAMQLALAGELRAGVARLDVIVLDIARRAGAAARHG